ncbi:phosphotransferase [Brachybacterium sp. AOP43-C2-M15]|uniref:phosphotransferase n=1 Tax=Brachybacterium sp. AOP43-C2-M15 TaxID=3457661 RepID=UPI0040334572
MHEEQLELTAGTAERLVADRMPELAGEEIRLLETSATTHHIVRIGEHLVARFPLRSADASRARTALEGEHRAMEELARLCPVPAPRPVAIGSPTPAFPMPWSVQTWLPGQIATPDGAESSPGLARDLASLLTALRAADTGGRRFAGGGRGGDLIAHEDWIRTCLERSKGLLPVAELSARWQRWRSLDREQDDVMSHGDLIPANLLTDGIRLTGVLDTGGFAPADPALDLVAVWHLLDRDRRRLVRDQLGGSDLEWERGRAWAFAQAIGLVWYYRTTNPPMAELGRSTLHRLLEP